MPNISNIIGSIMDVVSSLNRPLPGMPSPFEQPVDPGIDYGIPETEVDDDSWNEPTRGPEETHATPLHEPAPVTRPSSDQLLDQGPGMVSQGLPSSNTGMTPVPQSTGPVKPVTAELGTADLLDRSQGMVNEGLPSSDNGFIPVPQSTGPVKPVKAKSGTVGPIPETAGDESPPHESELVRMLEEEWIKWNREKAREVDAVKKSLVDRAPHLDFYGGNPPPVFVP
jgi:hypothetical protein